MAAVFGLQVRSTKKSVHGKCPSVVGKDHARCCLATNACDSLAVGSALQKRLACLIDWMKAWQVMVTVAVIPEMAAFVLVFVVVTVSFRMEDSALLKSVLLLSLFRRVSQLVVGHLWLP